MKKKKKKKKKKFKKHGYVSYIDAVANLDWDITALADLCQGASEKLGDPIDALNWVGEVLEKHVHQHRILRSKYFDEPLDFGSKDYMYRERERLRVWPEKKQAEK